jgi:hypothetical protein
MTDCHFSREEIDNIVRQTVKETLTSMGIDTHDPIEMQRDFQSLRDWRRASEAVRSKGTLTLVGIFVAGILGVLWLGLKYVLRQT